MARAMALGLGLALATGLAEADGVGAGLAVPIAVGVPEGTGDLAGLHAATTTRTSSAARGRFIGRGTPGCSLA
jgi:hypothetical protein